MAGSGFVQPRRAIMRRCGLHPFTTAAGAEARQLVSGVHVDPVKGDHNEEFVMNRTLVSLFTALAVMSATVPAQAQGFGIFFGDEPRDLYPERITCMTDHEIREAVAERGYSNISLNVAMGKKIQVRATRDGWVYLLDFNYCSGRIVDRQQLRPAR
jgi:hypothetical protein